MANNNDILDQYKETLEKLKKEIENKKNVLETIADFTQDCLVKGESVEDIYCCISEITKEDTIKCNPNLVSNIVDGFVQGCFRQKPEKDKRCEEYTDYRSSQSSYPSSNISEKKKTGGLDAKLNKSSEPEQNKNSNNGKPEYDSISNIEEKIESFIDEILKQRNKQDNNSRQK